MTITFQSTPPPYSTDQGYTSNVPCWWNFTFPNGRGANVCLSKYPFRFDVEWDTGDDGWSESSDQTTEQVEAKLNEVAALPVQQAA